LLGNMGDVVGVVALMNIPAAVMLWKLPETAGSELESITAEDQEALTPEIS
jgi:hypothetical protein